jgi:hypothetical protein
MSLACPNKSSKEWKMLVSQTGEDLANLAFVANGYRIPDVKTATEIKRAIAFKPLVESYAGMAHRLRKYNEQNGTSHYFTMEKAYGNTYKLEFKYNYLPVNVEKQRQRMAAKGDPLYAVNDFDADSFSNIYPINVASVKPKPPTSTPGEQLNLFSNATEAGFVKKINYTKSFLAREYFSSSNQVSTKEMLQNIANKNKVMAPIAQHLLDYADINNVNIFLEEGATTIPTPGTAIKSLGMYEIGNNRIRIPEFGGFGGTEEEIIVHEILHALSYKALRQNGKFTAAFQKLYEQSVKELGGYDDQTDTGEYANYNIDEFFVALFTNGPFIQKLESLPPINSEEFNNLFEEIFSYILDVLGFEKGTTLYSQAFAVASNIMQDTKQSVEAFNSSEAAYREYMQSEEYQRDLAAEAEVSKQVLGAQQNEGLNSIIDDRVDEILESAYTQVEAVEKKREKKINMEIMRQRQLLKNVKNSDEVTKIMSKIEKLKKESDIAEGRVILSKSINSFEDVLEFGNKQIGEIRKLLAKPAVSADDAYYAQRVLNLWIKAGDFSTSAQEHIILDEDEFNTSEDVILPDGTVIPSIRSKFRAIASQAQDLQGRLTAVKKEHVTAFVQQYTDGRLTTEDIYKHIADVNKVGALTLNLSRHNDPMMQTAFLAVEEANMLAQQEATEVWQKLDTITPKFLKKSGGNFNILKQLTADGKETGRVVHRFSTEFFDTRNTLMNNAFRAKDISGKLKKDPADIKMYFDWINANTITFDVRALFPDSQLEDGTLPNKFIYDSVTFTEEQKAKHIADLKAQLGEKGYRFYLEQAQTKLEKFKVLRQAIYESYQMEPGLSEAEKDALFMEWLKENSPYWGIDMTENPSSRKKEGGGFYAPKGVREYAIQVPRRSISGTATKWYDKNFTKIEADSDLLEYHEFLMKTLNQMRYLLPQQKMPMMGVGVLPTIEKNLMDIFSEKGMMMGVVPFWDKMKQLQTTTDFATNVYSDVDPATKEIEKNIQVKYISDTDSEVREIVKQKKIKHKQETGIPATLEQIKVFRNEAKDYLSRQKSWDVTKIMKAYTMEVLAHKHKSLIEPQIRLLDQAFKNKKEIVTNKAGGAQKKDGEVLDTQGLANAKSAWDYFFDSTYYGIGARKVEGVGKKKLYTAQETKEKKELEELIAKEADADSKEFLQKRLDNLGGYKTLSGSGDAVLKYMTLKGLGYNVFSGVSNMGFGLISNLIEASGGQNYSMKNFRKASMLVTNSIGRNLSFNALLSNPNGNAVKIRTLMDKWDLNSTSTKEMFDMSNKSSLSKLKRFGPFSIQERSEYVNIAPVMVAIMMEFDAKDPSGKTVTMWDAYEPSTGKLKAGYTTEVDEIKMFQKIKRVIEMNHGDYYNQLQVKETIAGRALSQFRTWMFEGFANRFESEKPDYALSYGSDEPYVRKGRYKSYTKGQLLTTGAAVGTAFLPGIGTAVGAGIGYIGGRLFGMHTNDNAISDTLFTLKQLARKLMFKPTKFEDKFNATDAANMRKNMTELYIMLTLMGIAMVLKGLAGADDDDEDDTISNFLINQTIRLRTDISFYSNPLEFEKLTKTALPMAQLVSDAYAVFTDIGNYYGEDAEDKTVFESGPFKGNPKWLIHAGQFLPGTSQLIRLYRTGDKVME